MLSEIYKEVAFWLGAAFLLFGSLFAACLCGGFVGFGVALKRNHVKQVVGRCGDFAVYICNTKQPFCYHTKAVCGGVPMKPLQLCLHCSKKGDKTS